MSMSSWNRRVLVLLLANLLAVAWASEPRETIPLTTWSFTDDPATMAPPAQATWSDVTVPHIFRQSGLPDNTAGWYRQTIVTTQADQGRCIQLRLEGAATVSEVFVNGTLIDRHVSPYTAAVFNLTPALRPGQANQIDVRISNRDVETRGCFGRSMLYFVNGGMFRKAWLIKSGAVHIHPELGSSGVFLTPRAITTDRAEIQIRTVVRNPLATPAVVTVEHQVADPAGTACATVTATATIAPGATTTLEAIAALTKPALWDLGRPNLYTVRTVLLADGQPSDALTERTGLRTITYQNKRFQLNGRETQFRGVNKHAQNEYVWNAVSDQELRHEWDLMADLGVNTVRLAHYPHSHFEYDQADERGMAVWAENGYAGPQKEPIDRLPTPDGERQTREMVRQNWNHPSILFWSCGNETEEPTAGHYASIIRQEDTTRLVTYASNRADPPNCDFIARNTYDGWYNNTYPDFAHKPKNSLISETGCGGWITHHEPHGVLEWKVDTYEPEEYSALFTEFRLQTVCRNDVADRQLFLWWTFREFYDLKFKQNRNTKGLLTLAGMPKDMYFAFQVFMNATKPVVHLNNRHYFLRRCAADEPIKAYANVPELELTVNGVSQGKQRSGAYRIPDAKQKLVDKKTKAESIVDVAGIPVDHVFLWKPTLAAGRNVIEVSDGAGHNDRMVVYQQLGATPLPADPAALVQNLRSSNTQNLAVYIDRPVEAQGPVYSDVDGSSDNTFDVLPGSIAGSSWIATRRLSDQSHLTDLSFRIAPASGGAIVSVMLSTGTHPVITLKKSKPADEKAAAALIKDLTALGFADTREAVVWRDHDLNRANAALWSRTFKAGESVTIPGQTLDYVVLVKPITR